MRRLLTAIAILLILVILHNPLIYAIANVQTFFRENNKSDAYFEAYRNRIDQLERELSTYERAQENLKLYDRSSYILAKIAIRNIYDLYDYLVVNTDALVEEGNAVLNEDGLVGFVDEANKMTAKVSLLTSGLKTSVKVGENYGILSEYDREKGEFVVHNIDNYKVVNVGEEVLTSGLQNATANLKIGQVSSVQIQGIEKVVRVKPYVDFDNLNYLIIEAK